MNYENLENSLKTEICTSYIINGGESFLTVSALKMIEKAMGLSFPTLNKNVFSDDFTGTAKDIVTCCENLPLFDKRRLVVVHDFIEKKNQSEREVFLRYLERPNPSTVLVFFSTNENEFFSSLETFSNKIKCDKVSLGFLFDFMRKRLTSLDIKADMDVIEKLADFCNYSITKIDTEIDKLYTVKMFYKKKTLKPEDIETYVPRDIDYMVFDLSNAITRGNKNRAYLVAYAMLKNREEPVFIISLIANHFRRMFFVSKSILSNSDLARLLNVKEYAIVKYKEKASFFSQRRLKVIFDECINVEFLVKSGKMNGENGVIYLISKILTI